MPSVAGQSHKIKNIHMHTEAVADSGTQQQHLVRCIVTVW